MKRVGLNWIYLYTNRLLLLLNRVTTFLVHLIDRAFIHIFKRVLYLKKLRRIRNQDVVLALEKVVIPL